MVRCLAIARHLESNSIRPLFVSKTKSVEPIANAKGYLIKILNNKIEPKNEIKEIITLSSKYNAGVIFLDVNNYNSFKDERAYHDYLIGLKKHGLFLVSFEDFKVYPQVSDMLVIPYVGAEAINLEEKTNCQCLIGSRYFVLPEQFLKVGHVTIKDKVQDVLITMGGADFHGITLKVLRAISATLIDLNLKIIIGPLSEIENKSIHDALDRFKGKYSILREVTNMAQLMSESDMAIINSGLTKYETASLGLPSIVISNNKYHSDIMHEFEKQGSVLHLGPVDRVTENSIGKATQLLIRDKRARDIMSFKGKSLVDGKGISRILAQIPKELFYG
jgi:UDP-2,4-diacetamido-2,4,6-trideoxy-beta-L-altropyranose hydrolase